jgi:phosphatidylglycerophosphatase A
VSFLAFRVFDIAKPWPISLLDRRLKNGWGVMVDDVAAGVLAGAVTAAVLAAAIAVTL